MNTELQRIIDDVFSSLREGINDADDSVVDASFWDIEELVCTFRQTVYAALAEKEDRNGQV